MMGPFIVAGLFALFALAALTSQTTIERAVRRAGGSVRKAPPSCLRTIEIMDCVIGRVGVQCRDMRFYPDGIAVVRYYIRDEFFFPFSALAIASNKRMGDGCKLKIMSRVNGRELYVPPHVRPDLLAFLIENGVEMPELPE